MKVYLAKIVKDYMIEPDGDKLVVPNYNITKGDNGLVLANFSICYDNDHEPVAETTCNYNKDIEGLNLLDMVEYLIERQNEYILKKIILALNDNDCQILKLEAYEG